MAEWDARSALATLRPRGPSDYATPNAGHHLTRAYPNPTRATSTKNDAKRPFTAIVCRFTPYPAALAGPPADAGRMKPPVPNTRTD